MPRSPGDATLDRARRGRLIGVFSEVLQLDLDAAVPDVTREEVPAWDSFNHVQLVVAIEEAFHIALDDDEVVAIGSLRDAEALLAGRALELGE